ncbi:hypothetical protein Geob_0525 [Geotalea daltonii FRC-32]|uniref:Uncharacterized protein n=1 Tax=Geotalea daltonii (strain DSM 22248 / JCM 15807 / FRC-32) TaxID=316067 RepID=B9LZT0_GEODF|nr:hypothetical protein [Geotalea daltonii]ACM18894.1 hypothetical protein Geob_0525 [Geotalea daltonii FRC-32]
MSHLLSQAALLALGINSFEPYIYRLEKDYAEGKFLDWPTIVLSHTVQATAISLFKLLPSGSQFDENARKFSTSSIFRIVLRLLPFRHESKEILDKRSIATMIRNIVDTHDVIDMMVNCTTEEFNLHRDILSYYIANRVNVIQEHIDKPKAEQFYKTAQATYWNRIKKSPLYTQSLDRIKKGETVLYKSRKDRVTSVCGDSSNFVMGILADISTFVHSIPPSIWMKDMDSLYSDSENNRNMVSVWLKVGNFYFARVMSIVLEQTNYETSPEAKRFFDYNRTVFAASEEADK